MTTAPNTQPTFIRTSNYWGITLTNEIVPGPLVGSATPKIVGTGGKNGSLIEELFVIETGNHPATVVFFFLSGPNISMNYGYCGEKAIAEKTNYTPADDTAYGVSLWRLLGPASCDAANPHRGLRLPPESTLYAGLTAAVSEPLLIVAMGGDY